MKTAYIEIAAASQLCGCSPTWLRYLEAHGRIPVALRTGTGRRLYTEEQIEEIKAVRAKQHADRQLAGK